MNSRRLSTVVALAVLLAGAGCKDLTSPNVNSSDLVDLTENPTRTKIAQAMRGLFAGSRSFMTARYGYVIETEILARNAYNLDIADLRFITELLEGPLQAGSIEFGGNFWAAPYENIRLSQIILDAIEAAPASELNQGEKAAARGLTKTNRALQLLTIVVTRDDLCNGTDGCPITTSADPTVLAPLVGKRAVYDEILRLLAEGRADLQTAQGAGAGFILELPSGYQDFADPATFTQFNWAITGRVLTYMGREFDPAFWTEALMALEQSFLSDARPLDFGAYHNFSADAGDQSNGLFQPSDDPNIRAHPSVLADAELKTNGQPDDRVLRKTRPISFRQLRGIGSDVGFAMYDDPAAPVPIIRNEELFLLRAEANVGLGNLETARTDINFIRLVSGGLPPVDPFASQQEALDQLLYEKRYSLLFEGGHRWIDLRRWDLLERLPLDLPSHQRNAVFPIPLTESIARNQ